MYSIRMDLYKVVSNLRTIMAVAAILLIFSGNAPAQADSAYLGQLTRDGVPQVTVVLSDDAGEYTKLACNDLVRCLSKAAGVRVPVVKELSKVTTPISIPIGESFGPIVSIMDMDIQKDGYVISTRNNFLHITGASDYGIANGIYSFLMDYIGVKWFAPGELYEVVPVNPSLAIPKISILKNPDFSYRVFSGVTGDAGAEWMRRNRLNINSENLPCYGFAHNLKDFFPPSVYSTESAQPCFTNPDVIKATAKAADDFFKKNPNATTFSLCLNDNPQYCRCPNCSALDEPMRKTRTGLNSHSGSYFYFVEQVAKIVEQTNPGKYLGCCASREVELPPRNIKKLPDNAVIALAQDTGQHFDPDYKNNDRDTWIAWSKITNRLGKYDYYGLGWLTPRYFPHLAADDIKFIHDHSANGFYSEVYPNWCVNAPQLYITSQLLWDSSKDPDKLLDEYYHTLFGLAAPEMKKFYATLEKYWAHSRKGQWFEGYDNVRQELAIVDGDLIEDAWQCLFRAKSLVIGPEAQRIIDVEDHFMLTYQVAKGYALSQTLASWKITGQEDLAKLIGDSLRALEMVRVAEKAHHDKWLTDPLYQTTYYQGDRFNAKLWAWEDEVRAGVQIALLKVSDYCHNKLSQEEGDTVWKDLRDRLLSDPTARRFKILDSLQPKLDCLKVPRPLAIDGDLSDWWHVNTIAFDPNRWDDGIKSGVVDRSASFKICWDNDYLYFACAATDSDMLQTRSDASIWEQDSVQIGFNFDVDELNTAGYDEDDCELGFAASPDGNIAWRWQSPKGLSNGKMDKAKLVIRRILGKTVYEAAVPWSELAISKAEDGVTFGFSVLINDADTGKQRTFLEWGGGLGLVKDPRQFVPVRLKN